MGSKVKPMQFDKIDSFYCINLHAALDSREEMFFTGTTGTPSSVLPDLLATARSGCKYNDPVSTKGTVIPIHKRVPEDSPVSKPRVRVYYGTTPGRLPGTNDLDCTTREDSSKVDRSPMTT